jgi:hypothetical protein
MLVGAYPFEDHEDPKNFRKTINVLYSFASLFFSNYPLFFTVHEFFIVYLQRIMAVQYKIPDYVHISQDCRHLLSHIFVANPSRVCMNKPCLRTTINLYYKGNITLLCVGRCPFIELHIMSIILGN